MASEPERKIRSYVINKYQRWKKNHVVAKKTAVEVENIQLLPFFFIFTG